MRVWTTSQFAHLLGPLPGRASILWCYCQTLGRNSNRCSIMINTMIIFSFHNIRVRTHRKGDNSPTHVRYNDAWGPNIFHLWNHIKQPLPFCFISYHFYNITLKHISGLYIMSKHIYYVSCLSYIVLYHIMHITYPSTYHIILRTYHTINHIITCTTSSNISYHNIYYITNTSYHSHIIDMSFHKHLAPIKHMTRTDPRDTCHHIEKKF